MFNILDYYCDTGKIHSSKTKKLNDKSDSNWQIIKNKTGFLPTTSTWIERLFCIKNNIDSCLLCPVCNLKELAFRDRSYSATCGRTCGNILGKINRERTLIERYGVNSPSKVKEFRERAIQTHKETLLHNKEQILKKRFETLDTNTPNWRRKPEIYLSTEEKKKSRIEKAIKKYGVENHNQLPEYREQISRNAKQRHREKKKLAFDILDSKEKLYELYQKYNSEEIKDILGVSIHTVTTRLLYHKIEKKLSKSTSKAQIRIFDLLKELLPEEDIKICYKYNKSKEFDIFIPSKKLAIEYNGLYWHSDNRNKHQEKWLDAKSIGIDLLTIDELSWHNSREKWISIIKNKIGLSDKIYARKCAISRVSKEVEKEFLNRNHIQGYIASSNNIGLHYNNELVFLVSTGNSRFNKNYDIEILRVCSKLGTRVIGGFSKGLSKILENYNQVKIISYCNLIYGNGSMYKAVGFEENSITTPNYSWWNNKWFLSRYQTQKHKLQKLYEDKIIITYDSSLSEEKNMTNNKFKKYYDCGNTSYSLSVNKGL